MQKLIRAGFGNNNVDTCARVCHSPTGYGLGQAFGTSAGTQDFDSVEDTDVVMVIGANPTDGHPVFASRMKKRLRQGAKLIVIDPRRIEMVASPHIKADYHLPLMPGTNVAVVTALAHVIVTEGLCDEAFVRERCDWSEFSGLGRVRLRGAHSPEAIEMYSSVEPELIRGAARLFAPAATAAIYYGLGVTEHSQGSTTVMAIANLAMATGNIGRRGVGVNPLRGQNNVQGSCDMGSFPHELPGYRHISDDATRAIFEKLWGVELNKEPGLRIPNMLDAAVEGSFKGIYIQGEDILQSDPDTKHVSAGLAAMECVVVQDLFLNETANYAHVFLPGSTFLEKDGTFTNAERRINRVRKVMTPEERLCRLGSDAEPGQCHGPELDLHPSVRDHGRDRGDRRRPSRWSPTTISKRWARFSGRATRRRPRARRSCISTASCAARASSSAPNMSRPTRRPARASRCCSPPAACSASIMSAPRPGAPAIVAWHAEDRLEIHPHDAEQRGIRDGDWVRLQSRAGETSLRALITEKVAPGVVYTTFHHPDTQANVITTDFSDWATNCPEYKVTAVQISPSNGPSEWQEEYDELSRRSRRIVGKLEAAGKELLSVATYPSALPGISPTGGDRMARSSPRSVEVRSSGCLGRAAVHLAALPLEGEMSGRTEGGTPAMPRPPAASPKSSSATAPSPKATAPSPKNPPSPFPMAAPPSR